VKRFGEKCRYLPTDNSNKTDIMPKPKTGLTKRKSKATKTRARTAKKLERKGRERSLSTHGMGKLTAAEKVALSRGLSGKSDVSSPAKYKAEVEGMGAKKISQRQRKRTVKGSTYTPKKPKRR
jgi:hypothetical protein